MTSVIYIAILANIDLLANQRKTIMHGASATEVKNKFGQILEMAMTEPIAIEKNGRQVVVMMSMSEYQRLLEIEDRYWGEIALKAIEDGFLTVNDTKAWIERKLDVKAID